MERRHPFEAAHAGGAHSNHPPVALAAGGNGLHQRLTHLHPFAVQLQLAEVFGFHRPKRAQPHMQGDTGPLDAFLCQGRQQLLTEVKPSGGSSHRPGLGGKTGLVAVVIGFLVLVDVGRQRHHAVAQQQGLQAGRIAALRRELNQAAAAALLHRQHLQRQVGLPISHQGNAVARPEALGGAG